MYVFTQKALSSLTPTLTLALTADERARSRYRYKCAGSITDNGGLTSKKTVNSISVALNEIYLELPRGTTLYHQDCLVGDDHHQILQIVAKPEPVLTVRAQRLPLESEDFANLGDPRQQLLWAAYHLGNRHVALEVGADYLRLAPDSVLVTMLQQLGLSVTAETVSFQPEAGAYGHHH